MSKAGRRRLAESAPLPEAFRNAVPRAEKRSGRLLHLS